MCFPAIAELALKNQPFDRHRSPLARVRIAGSFAFRSDKRRERYYHYRRCRRRREIVVAQPGSVQQQWTATTRARP